MNNSMKNKVNASIKCTAIAITLLSFIAIPQISISGAAGFDAATNAKLARVKAKQRVIAKKQKEEAKKAGKSGEGSSSGGCGNVDIGNVTQERGSKVREVIVVIDGDVINSNNNCK